MSPDDNSMSWTIPRLCISICCFCALSTFPSFPLQISTNQSKTASQLQLSHTAYNNTISTSKHSSSNLYPSTRSISLLTFYIFSLCERGMHALNTRQTSPLIFSPLSDLTKSSSDLSDYIAMSTINTSASTKAIADSSNGRETPPPQARKHGRTPEQGAEEQQRILMETYVIDNDSPLAHSSAPPVSPKIAPKRKMKGYKLAPPPAAATGADDSPSPPKKTKPVKRTLTTSSSSDEPDSTPTRRSARNITKKRPWEASDNEPESPLAKKSKTSATTSGSTIAKPGPSTFTPINDAPMSKKKAGKLPVTEDERPVSTRPESFMKQLRGKLPKTHTPSDELADKAADGDEQEVEDAGQTGGKKATKGKAKKAKGKAKQVEQDVGVDEQVDKVDDDDADQTDGKKSGKGKGKSKKTGEKQIIIPHDFVGQETGMGTSANKPDIPAGSGIEVLDKAWPCANRQCNTGMTWLLRDGENSADGFGRKTGSQFFGRNKAETRLMDNDVWHTYCRKCYQRGYYALTNQKKDGEQYQNKPQEGAASWHMGNLRAQFQRLQLWRPDATFKVQLTKNMHARSNAWHATLRLHPDDVAAAKVAFAQHAKFGSKTRKPAKNGEVAAPKPEQAFPVELVDSFTQDACGDECDYERVEEILDHVQGMLDAGTITQVPPVEFLISQPVDGEEIRDATKNYRRWIAETDARDAATSGEETTSGDENGDDAAIEQGDAEVQAGDALFAAAEAAGSDEEEASEDEEEAPTPWKMYPTESNPHNIVRSSTYGMPPLKIVTEQVMAEAWARTHAKRAREAEEAEASKRMKL